jgi:hypothetical protein
MKFAICGKSWRLRQRLPAPLIYTHSTVGMESKMEFLMVGNLFRPTMARQGLLKALLLAGTGMVAVSWAEAAAAQVLVPGELVVSTSTYQDTGAVAGLTAGVSKLPGSSAGSSVAAVSSGNYLTVWNNDTVDGSFGVTSPITLQTVTTGGAVTNTLAINPSQVVTSFSSKSELALNISPDGKSLSFMGYAGAGVGTLDVSNSDTPGISDPTNPVTTFFGTSHAYARTITTVSANGTVTYTPTNAYGGNNGRAAILGTDGLYYTVGNANNGSSKTANPITTSTGLEAFTPMNSSSATVTPANPNPVDPGYSSIAGDKVGKDSNFRGLTQYNGNLYFTKGSGSNGIDTVYTVTNPSLPTGSAGTISILPGFPTSPAKTAPDYTPFGLFFANATTLYVADEGSGDAKDQGLGSHAGLEKWSLLGGTWHLDYTLQSGLIGTSYTLCPNSTETTGCANAYDTVTNTGLRNITGSVNSDGTVTIWGATSDSSASGDNGADPNEVVQITDLVSATTLPTDENFSVFENPVYGQVYRGVAFDPVAVPEPTALILVGAGLAGVVASRRRKKAAAVG